MWLQGKQWIKVGWAAGIGVSVGIAAAVISANRPSIHTVSIASPSPYIVPVSATSVTSPSSEEQTITGDTPQSSSREIERLRTRNRRLEALVTVLKQRAADRQ